MVFNLYLPKGTGGLPPTGKTLEQYSWDEISKISKKGKASEYGFATGQTKSFSLDGTTYNAQIIGFDHDDVVDSAQYGGAKAGITFQLENCLNTTYPMNSTPTNVNGWDGCLMRTTTLPDIFNKLPADLQSVIVTVKKKASAGNKSMQIITSNDNLFLLCEKEIFGTIGYADLGEGEWYAYYKNGGSTVKTVGGSANVWWERSPHGSNTTKFCLVYSDGNFDIDNANYSYGVAFGFCI